MHQSRAAGLVNAVLRRAERRIADLPQPATGDPAEDLAIRHSHPTWLVRRWLAHFGDDDTTALLVWNNTRPLHALRINTIKTTPAAFRADLDGRGIAWQPSAYLGDFVRVPRLQAVIRAGLLARGQAAVQDEAAALVVRLLDPQPGETIIDACAAPGGKALYTAQRMSGRGVVRAYDVHAGRLGLVARSAEAQAIPIVATEAADVRELARRADAPQADRVLVDAPCSGTGVLAKRADARWQRRPEDIDTLAVLQRELLDAAARLVRPGGLLVYSTCSLEPEENEAQVRAFLERHADFGAESAAPFIPSQTLSAGGNLATLPHRHHTDGAFAARLRRIG